MQKFLLLGLLLILGFSVAVSARNGHKFDGPPGHERHHQEEKENNDSFVKRERRIQTRKVLEETAGQLLQAQKAARFGHYRYGLGKAYAHQEQARDFYYDGQYESAIAHSMRARELAIEIIDCNRPEHEGRPSRHPERLEDDLDRKLTIKIVDDKVALRLQFTL